MPGMAPIEVRPFRDEDAAGVARVVGALSPEVLTTPASLLHWLHGQPPRARTAGWVAVDGGEVVGWAQGRLRWTVADPGVGGAWVGVLPRARRQGAGGRLYELAEEHVSAAGAHTIRSSVGDDADGRGFAERRGYRETRQGQFWTIDPAAADLSELPELAAARGAEGFRLATLGELLDRPRDLHALYDEAEFDIPGDDERTVLPYAEWKEETLGNPLLDPEASVLVLHGDRPVAFAWLLVDRDGGRAEHELTGTLRAYRGRGLARLAKLASLRWCADHAVTTVLTANDAENAPMLAVNRRLGYRPTIVLSDIAKEL
jgi:GNAT superfamily N-acetyltransferase